MADLLVGVWTPVYGPPPCRVQRHPGMGEVIERRAARPLVDSARAGVGLPASVVAPLRARCVPETGKTGDAACCGGRAGRPAAGPDRWGPRAGAGALFPPGPEVRRPPPPVSVGPPRRIAPRGAR